MSGKQEQERRREPRQAILPGMSMYCDAPEGIACILLKTASDIFSRWFLALRGAMSRERARRDEYREANGLKRKAKVDPMPLSPSNEESSVSEISESVIRSMFGDSVADYASSCYRKALSSGDMRSFKIRLLMLKARDSLRGNTKEEFAYWMPDYISRAESLAGCVPCPGPRRMSRAEKERKLQREREKNAEQDLFSRDWSKKRPTSDFDKNRKNVILGSCTKNKDSFDHNGFFNISESTTCENNTSVTEIEKTVKHDIRKSKVIFCDSVAEAKSIVADMKKGLLSPAESMGMICVAGGLAADDERPGEGFSDGARDNRRRPERDAYRSAGEIVEGIRSGRISGYSKASDVVSGMEAGDITPMEAVMFIEAIVRMREPSVEAQPRRRASKARDAWYEFNGRSDGELAGRCSGYDGYW